MYEYIENTGISLGGDARHPAGKLTALMESKLVGEGACCSSPKTPFLSSVLCIPYRYTRGTEVNFPKAEGLAPLPLPVASTPRTVMNRGRKSS